MFAEEKNKKQIGSFDELRNVLFVVAGYFQGFNKTNDVKIDPFINGLVRDVLALSPAEEKPTEPDYKP